MPKGVYERKPNLSRNGHGDGSKSTTAPAAAPEPVMAAAPKTPVVKRVYEIAAADMPFEHRLFDLYRDIRFRLENTTPAYALVFVFEVDQSELDRIVRELCDLVIERFGQNTIEIAGEVSPDGQALLYARRGSKWRKRERSAYNDSEWDA